MVCIHLVVFQKSFLPVKVATPELQLEHVVPADQDDSAEDEDGGGDEQEDVADFEAPLVLRRPRAPSPEGHYTCS